MRPNSLSSLAARNFLWPKIHFVSVIRKFTEYSNLTLKPVFTGRSSQLMLFRFLKKIVVTGCLNLDYINFCL